MSEPTSDAAIEAALKDLPGWTHEDHALKKTFQFGAFPEAISFITRVAFEAERRVHHPEIRNVYGTVEIALKTHDAGDVVTDQDIALARAIEQISWI